MTWCVLVLLLLYYSYSRQSDSAIWTFQATWFWDIPTSCGHTLQRSSELSEMKHWMNVGYHSTLPPWNTMATNDDIMTTTTTYQGYPWQSCRLRSCIAHPFGPWEMIGARRLPCWWLICSFIKGKAVKEISRSASRNGTVSCTIESPQISSKKQWFSSSTRLLAAFAIAWNCWSCSEDSRMKRWIDCVPFSPTILLWRSILWRWPR